MRYSRVSCRQTGLYGHRVAHRWLLLGRGGVANRPRPPPRGENDRMPRSKGGGDEDAGGAVAGCCAPASDVRDVALCVALCARVSRCVTRVSVKVELCNHLGFAASYLRVFTTGLG